MANSYEYLENEELFQIATQQLHEEPKKTKAQLEVLRRWLRTQEHIICLQTDEFLIRFLRANHFDQAKTQQMLDDFCTLRGSEDYAYLWFNYPSRNEANKLFQLMENGFFIPLGVNKAGEQVVLFRAGYWDPANDDFHTMIQAMCLCFDILFLDPRVQIAGLSTIVDFDQFTQAHVTAWSNEAVAKLMFMQKAMPLRIKHVHYYRTSLVVNGIYELFRLFLDQSVIDLIRWHRSDEDSLKEAIGEEILPAEYGGANRPVSALIADWILNTKDNWNAIEELRAVQVDNSKRKDGSVSSVKEYLNKLNESRKE